MSDVKGIQVDGSDPKELLLSDGSRLSLNDERAPTEWVRAGDAREAAGGLSLAAALEVAGEDYRDYIRVRTRSEAAWLRIVSEWCAEQAERLEGDLRSSAAG